MEYRLNVIPMPAPRLNFKSRFNPKKKALHERYMNWKELIKHEVKRVGFFPDDTLDVVFAMPIPKSCSKKRMLALEGAAHQKRPDLDNLLKAFLDAVWVEDSRVWQIKAMKIWSSTPCIIITEENLDECN